MNVSVHPDTAVSSIAAAIGEPARARMLYCLMDGHARTSTELAAVAGVSPSTASAHLARLRTARLVSVAAQGKHRFYSVQGPRVARALEGLSVLASDGRNEFVPRTPTRLRAARTCYDHIAGALGVTLRERFEALDWLSTDADCEDPSYDVTAAGRRAFAAIGIDVDATRARRRRFASGCMDWSERRLHLGGALGAAVLDAAVKHQWVVRELDSRALAVTDRGRQEMRNRFGVGV
jgi:DNA-binding transcriptional ArsR family regulator